LVTITEQQINQLLGAMKGKKIAVIGDLMLDRYIWGRVSRISPEAPVPIVDMESEQVRLGGAANVAQNIKSLGGHPHLLGVVGEDNSGKALIDMLGEQSFPIDGILTDPSRPTTVKTRVIAHDQHVVRIDREDKNDISSPIQKRLLEILRRIIADVDGIVIEDYNKGVLSKHVIKETIALGTTHKKVITVDPKFNNFFEYKDVTVMKPNRKEIEEVLGVRLRSRDEINATGKMLLQKLNAENVLLTLGEQGMSLFESNGDISHISTKALNVADVSGAGDTVIATLSMSLAAGASMKEAVSVANFAGGIVCGYVGIIPIDPHELKRTILNDNIRSMET
jgi:rfaE bifunctional protein kinase chain/domain